MNKDLFLLVFSGLGLFVLGSIWVMYCLSKQDIETPDPMEEYLKRVKRNQKRVK